jgi:hypothetical protein
MPPPRPGIVVLGRFGNDEHSAIMTDMLDNSARHVPQSDEIAEPLKSLQQNEKRQPRWFSFGRSLGQLQLALSRRVKIYQLPAGRDTL